MASQSRRFSLIFHGGAGRLIVKSEAKEFRYQRLGRILKQAYQYCLDESLSPIDIVEKVIVLLEDNPHFNAGKGSIFTNKGTHELDASIMDGELLKCASVSLLKDIKNPITLAKHLLIDNINNKIPHSMIFGDGASQYAKYKAAELESLSKNDNNKNKDNKNKLNDKKNDIIFVENNYFDTQLRFKQFKRAQAINNGEQQNNTNTNTNDNSNELKSNKTFLDHDLHINSNANSNETDDKTSTVGCCVWIENKGCCAGTSTGGMTYKMVGRIGDSPIIGAGTYANDKTLSISATGVGEEFIRRLSCFDVHARMLYKNQNIDQAMKGHINDYFGGFGKKNKEIGGFIGIDSTNGQIASHFNSIGMNRGYVTNHMFNSNKNKNNGSNKQAKLVAKVGVWEDVVDFPVL